MPKGQKIKKEGHYTKVFGNPSGYKVLKEIKDYAEFPCLEPMEVQYGRRQMLQFILDRLKATAGKKEVYANILYEVELL